VIKGLSELLNSNILYYRFGDKYQFIELSSGEIINIPTDIPKGLMPKDTGIREGMILELREINKTT
jgi:deoxycytidine triphosphate deaminase